MSSVSDFYAKIMADKVIMKQITDILGGTPVENADDEQLSKIGAIAKGMGFSISVEDARNYFGGSEEELSDESLEAVAGGTTTPQEKTCPGDAFVVNPNRPWDPLKPAPNPFADDSK